MKWNRQSLVPDVVVCGSAIVGSFIVFYFFHDNWYHGSNAFGGLGDDPAANPAYHLIRQEYWFLVYAATGVVAGLLSGIGFAMNLRSALLRLGTVGLIALVADGAEPHVGATISLPMALAGLGVSATMSLFHGLLSHWLEEVETKPKGDPKS